MWLVWRWEQEKPSLLLDQSFLGPVGLLGEKGTQQRLSSNGSVVFWMDTRSWTVLCVFWGCFVCSSGMLQRKEVSWSAPGAVVFPSLTSFASTSSDFLGHGEHRGRHDVALWVWVNVCVNQVSGRGCPHGRTSLRVCSGLEEPNKLKPYLMVKIFINFSTLSDIQGGWCSAVTSPPREWVSHQADTQDRRICAVMWVRTQQTGLWWGFLT